jgi:hypothetical protein
MPAFLNGRHANELASRKKERNMTSTVIDVIAAPLILMQAKLPSSWSQISINVDTRPPVNEAVVVLDRKKRKRSTSSSAQNLQPSSTHRSLSDEVEVQTHNSLFEDASNMAPVVLKPDKKMQKRITNEDKIAVLDVKKIILHNISQLPMNVEKLDKILHGMTYNLDQIVSSTNYRAVLKDDKNNKLTYTNDIRFVSKSYEDNYLRQPINDEEKKCVRGVDCECMHIDKTQPFVGVEYVLPWETEKHGMTGMCLPCVRATTQILFYDIIHSGATVNGIIQRFYNKHSVQGEYKLSKMLVCPPNGPIENLPMPILRHQRNLYKVYKENKIYYMKQINVDFQ